MYIENQFNKTEEEFLSILIRRCNKFNKEIDIERVNLPEKFNLRTEKITDKLYEAGFLVYDSQIEELANYKNMLTDEGYMYFENKISYFAEQLGELEPFEELLKLLLIDYEYRNIQVTDYYMQIDTSKAPSYIQDNRKILFEKLEYMDIVSSKNLYGIGLGHLTFYPKAINYFEKAAQERTREVLKRESLQTPQTSVTIGSINAPNSSVVVGDVNNSETKVDNTAEEKSNFWKTVERFGIVLGIIVTIITIVLLFVD